MKEEWRDIRDYEGFYQVSNLGRVRSVDRWIDRKGSPYLAKGKVLSMNKLNKSGYRICCLSRNDNKKYMRFNRLVAIAFIPNPEDKPFVNHIDGDRLNDRFDNLEWCTNGENIQHAYDTGLAKKGEDHIQSKLSKQEVRDIYVLAKNKTYRQWEIAEKYKISRPLVSKILNGKERSEDTEDLRNSDTNETI